MWNRLRYTAWAPAYNAIARLARFGAGTGLDLDFLPSNVHVTAIDVTPAMLEHDAVVMRLIPCGHAATRTPLE